MFMHLEKKSTWYPLSRKVSFLYGSTLYEICNIIYDSCTTIVFVCSSLHFASSSVTLSCRLIGPVSPSCRHNLVSANSHLLTSLHLTSLLSSVVLLSQSLSRFFRFAIFVLIRWWRMSIFYFFLKISERLFSSWSARPKREGNEKGGDRAWLRMRYLQCNWSVDHSTVTKWLMKFLSGCKNHANQARSAWISRPCLKPVRQIRLGAFRGY